MSGTEGFNGFLSDSSLLAKLIDLEMEVPGDGCNINVRRNYGGTSDK